MHGGAAGSALSAQPCAVGDLVVLAAELDLDVREATGHNDGPEVEAMLADVGMPAGASWCGAGVYHWMTRAGVKLPGAPSRYAWAPSWHPASRVIWRASDATTMRRTRAEQQPGNAAAARASALFQQPQAGDVFGVWYNSLGRVAHVGVVKQWGVPGSPQYVITIEGNTGSGDALSREGDGVYCKRRLIRQLYCVSRWAC